MRTYLISLVFLASSVQAGLITHTDYQSGAVISAAGQNANENLLFNEFNGNIDNANIKAGGVTGTNIANTTITNANFAASVSSTFTAVNQHWAYRRPNLNRVSNTVVGIETGLDGVAGDGVIMFPDGNQRTDTATARIRGDISQNADWTNSTEVSLKGGLDTGSSANQTWYAIYAVKATGFPLDWVLVASTITPTQANYANLNTKFTALSWRYLGTIRYGDSSGVIDQFTMHGPVTFLRNDSTAGAVHSHSFGVLLSSSASSSSLTWTYSAGGGNLQVPSNILMGYIKAGGIASQGSALENSASSILGQCSHATTGGCDNLALMSLEDGVKNISVSASAIACDIFLYGWVDGSLSEGSLSLL